MIRVLFYLVSFIFLGVLEFGFFHALNSGLAYTPVLISFGVYFIFRMKVDLGIAWIMASAVLSDMFALHSVFEIFILGFLSILLVFVIQQYITHASVYAVWFVSSVFIFIWTFIVLILNGLIYGSIGDVTWGFVLWKTSLYGGFLTASLMLILPRVEKFLLRRFRISI